VDEGEGPFDASVEKTSGYGPADMHLAEVRDLAD